ncbi:aminoacyl-tRNA hydrolase [Candidatus Saccharibacteria bacterium]|nr:aminoacyl-tRNA hydrolase [Candidatus Saccharibacteria bacterium]
MGLFQKKPVTVAVPFYTIGNTRTVLILGLGNPGEEYIGTRHNIGFEVLNYFAKQNDFPDWTAKKDLKCELTTANMSENRVILCKPTTYMNRCGEAAQAVQRFFRIYNQQTLAVYDELAIQFGQLRIRLGGSDAGHNGVKSLIQYLGEDFSRLRVGIGSEGAENVENSNFVLSKFSQEEQVTVPKILQEANALITEYIFSGSLPHNTRTVI